MATETFIVELRTKGARTTRKQIDAIGRSASQTRKTLAFLRSSLVVFAAINVFSRLGKSLVDFGQEMSNVKAISGATGQQFDELRNKAKQLGATTRFTATQAAEGMTFLSRAGFDANEVLSAIPDTLNLAQAGALDLGRAADITSNVLKGFGLEAAETERVVDTLANTAASSNTNVEQLGKAMSFAAPAAAVLGVDIETTAAAIGILSDAGIQASRAGTGMRKIFIKLSEPLGKGAETVANLGLSIADLNIGVRGLTPVLQTLAEKNITLGEAAKLVGERQATALLILLRSVDGVDKLTAANKKALGITKKLAAIMDDNLKGTLLKVKSAFEAVILAVGDSGATGALRSFFELLAKVLRNVAKNADVLIFAFETLAVVTGIKLATVAIPKLTKAFVALNLVIKANLIVAIIAAIVFAVVAIVKFADKISLGGESLATLRDIAIVTFDAIREKLKVIENAFRFTFGFIRKFVKKTFSGVFGDVDFSLKGILRGVAFVVDKTIGLFKGLVTAIKLVFSNLPAALEAVFVLAFNTISITLTDFINLTIRGINIILKFLKKDTIEELDAFEIQASKRAKNLAKAIKTAIVSELAGQTGAVDFVDRLLDRAENRAIERGFAADAEAFGKSFALVAPPIFAGKDLGGDKRKKGVSDEFKKSEAALRSLEASVAPFLASLDAIEEAQKIINDATAKGIDLRISEEELIKRIRREQIGAGQTTTQLAEQINVLARARMNDIISLEEEIKLTRDANIAFLEGQRDFESGVERAFLKGTDAATNFAAQSELVITDAFKSAGDVLNDFFKTGELDAKSLITTLITLAAKLLTIKAIEAVGGGVGGIGGGGVGNGIGAIIAQSVIGGIGGMAQGGSFTVGKNNAVANLGAGTDNRLIAFRAEDGEEVTVTPRNRAAPGGGMQIIQNINVRDADSFKRSQGQNLMRGQAALMRVQRRR